MHSFSFEAIGTLWIIDLGIDSSAVEVLKPKIYERIEEFDRSYSRFRTDSEIVKWSKKTGEYSTPSDFKPLFELYQEFYKATNGLFTPVIGNTLIEAGYDATYSLIPKKINKVRPLDEVIELKNKTVNIKRQTILDFGAAGKGYLVDLIAKLLDDAKIDDYVINAGGDVLQKGKNVLRVGLEHPADHEKAIGVAEIKNQSICASSGNRRTWGEFHHIINPVTLKSPTEVLETFVVADTAILADALATSLILLPYPEAFEDFKFEYILLYKDYSVKISSGFPGELFTS